MDPLRRARLQELQAIFEVREEFGTTPAKEILFETIADDLNRRHGRPVVVPRERKLIGGRLPREADRPGSERWPQVGN